ncbi:MAG: Exopolyphosphatase, putative [Methanomicrobiales archaeon 53_19]|nr:MAG: Exopolyphosphatase, putative [Methanocalculus sp. 52_23]KUL00399.1 MAG: Exopolyphosphatase, putative [Methanomicrobiales archaeon 53_19]
MQQNTLSGDGSMSNRLEMIRAFAAGYSPDQDHDEQVMKNALMLFDQLTPLHALSGEERFLLQAAAILHDIGWSQPGGAHNKTGAGMIRRDSTLPLKSAEREIIALLVRYHRKAPPSLQQRRFAELDQGDRERVQKLASLLRIADALDRSHQSLVDTITATIREDEVIIHCSSGSEGYLECDYALERSDLFTTLFSREVVIDWRIAP